MNYLFGFLMFPLTLAVFYVSTVALIASAREVEQEADIDMTHLPKSTLDTLNAGMDALQQDQARKNV